MPYSASIGGRWLTVSNFDWAFATQESREARRAALVAQFEEPNKGLARATDLEHQIAAIKHLKSPTYIGLRIPVWPIRLLLLLPPMLQLRSLFRQHSALGKGLCPTCRYNLTGNTSGICPE